MCICPAITPPPKKNDIPSIQKWLAVLLANSNKDDELHLALTMEDKARLIAIRYQLADLVNKVPFDKLNFSK